MIGMYHDSVHGFILLHLTRDSEEARWTVPRPKEYSRHGVNGETCQRLPLNTATHQHPVNFRIHSQRPGEQEDGVGGGLEG